MVIVNKLTKVQVSHIAQLANLKLISKEVNKFQKQLSEIITYVEKLKEVDTSGVEPTSQTTGLENVTRKDKRRVENRLSQKEALSGTEKTHNGYFVVPAIFTKQDSEF